MSAFFENIGRAAALPQCPIGSDACDCMHFILLMLYVFNLCVLIFSILTIFLTTLSASLSSNLSHGKTIKCSSSKPLSSSLSHSKTIKCSSSKHV